MKRATNLVEIVDPYLDTDVYDFVDTLDTVISVRLITGNPKQLFIQQLHALQATTRKIEARSNTSSHDRFVILDGQEAWHLGASINGLGKKACMINKIVGPVQLGKLAADFSAWWNAGTNL